MHHCSSGILDITVGTWRPQPHQEDFSDREGGVSGALGEERGRGKGGKGGKEDVRQVVQVPFLHMMDDGRCGEGRATMSVCRSGGGGSDAFVGNKDRLILPGYH